MKVVSTDRGKAPIVAFLISTATITTPMAANGLHAARMRWFPLTEHHAGQLVSLLQRDERLRSRGVVGMSSAKPTAPWVV
jgi:hypothetical protein